MLAKIYSAAVYGVDAYEVEIEVNGAGGDKIFMASYWRTDALGLRLGARRRPAAGSSKG